jgi:hypothetical protein
MLVISILFLRVIVFIVGLLLIAVTMRSALITFVLPRSAPETISRLCFRLLRRLFDWRIRWAKTYLQRDRIMALYAPLSLILLLPIWLVLVALGFGCLYWATGMASTVDDLILSGSSLLTLGFARGDHLIHDIFSFVEATLGLILVAVLIAYLPTMYNAFSQRESAVSRLSVRADSPPSALEFILRAHRIGALENLHDFWQEWEIWFAELEESHTSLAALVFFRSPDPQRSWVTAAGTVLDAAALILTVVDIPRQPQAALCLRSGFLALQRIADFFQIDYPADPLFPADPIAVTRQEFDDLCQTLMAHGVPLHEELDQAWQDFGGWRVNYDQALLALCTLTMAPEAPWSTDRAPVYRPLPLLG